MGVGRPPKKTLRGIAKSQLSKSPNGDQSASTSSDPISQSPSSQSPRERQPQRTPGRAPTLTEKVETLEKTVAHLTQENESLLAKVAEHEITISKMKDEKVLMGKRHSYEISKIAQPSSSQALVVHSSAGRAVQGAYAYDAPREGTLSVDLSMTELPAAQQRKTTADSG